MPDTTDGVGADAARRMAARQDRMALSQIVRDNGVCEATGQPLRTEDAVAMTVAAGPGVCRLAVVSGTHWDSAMGPLSAADPDVDPDVLDGRTLFAIAGKVSRTARRPRSPQSPGPGTGPVQPPLLQPPPRAPRAGGPAQRA
jgi:hypothetical protein